MGHTRTSPGYNCEVAHQHVVRADLWYPPMAVRLVGGRGGHQSFMTGSKWAAIFPLT